MSSCLQNIDDFFPQLQADGPAKRPFLDNAGFDLGLDVTIDITCVVTLLDVDIGTALEFRLQVAVSLSCNKDFVSFPLSTRARTQHVLGDRRASAAYAGHIHQAHQQQWCSVGILPKAALVVTSTFSCCEGRSDRHSSSVCCKYPIPVLRKIPLIPITAIDKTSNYGRGVLALVLLVVTVEICEGVVVGLRFGIIDNPRPIEISTKL